MELSPALRLFYYPFTCATAAHIILEESGLAYERQLVDIQGGQHRQTDYIKLNPKGIVPALQIGQQLLTENQAILTYIAEQAPAQQLIPPANTLARARAHEWMNYCAASMHCYARSVFRPCAYAGESVEAQIAVRDNGLCMMRNGSKLIEEKLDEDKWSSGDHFSVSDAYLYIIYLWSQDERMARKGEPASQFPKWRALANRVHNRTSTQAIVKVELLDRPNYKFPDFS